MDAESLEKVADALLRSYDLDPVQQRRLPARQAVVDMIGGVRRILFPGYYAEEPLLESSRRHYVGTWLCELHNSLVSLIERVLAHSVDDARQALDAAEITGLFIEALPALREQLKLDAEAAVSGDPAANSVEEVILTYPGFEAITVHRIAHWLWRNQVPFIPRIIAEYAHSQTGIDIHPGATIGKSFFIDHGTGVVIGETTLIGDWVKVYQGVTLGALSVERSQAGKKRHPTIEDGVVLYAGATVLGGRTIIGCDAVIGGNVWLTTSVEPGTTVLESPPDLDFRTRTTPPSSIGECES
jgi:serine O-acetyltransferase